MTIAFIQVLSDDIAAIKLKIENFFTNTVEPDVVKVETDVIDVVKLWAAQFETDFGKAALAAVGAVIAGFADGGWPAVPALAAAAGELLVGQGFSIAEADAQTVILNAARTALNAAQPPIVPVVVPPAPATVQAVGVAAEAASS